MKYFKNILILILSFIALGNGATVFAHATPINYLPESSTVLDQATQKVTIRFSERIDVAGSNITVFGPNGNEVDDNTPAVDSNDSHIFSVGVTSTDPGTYTVSWQVVSADDGHFTKGAYNFSVQTLSDNNVAEEQTQVVFLSKNNEGIATSFELIGQGMLWGALIVLVMFWRQLSQNSLMKDYAIKFNKRFIWFAVLGLILILLGSAGYILVKSGDLGELRTLAFAPALKIFLATSAGKFAMYRFVLALVFLVGLFIVRKKILNATKFNFADGVLFLVLILLAAARIASSHAVASHFLPWFTVTDHIFHMIFKGLWFGLIAAAVVLLMPQIKQIRELNFFYPLMNRLSNFLTVIFGVVGLTGAYIVWLDLKVGANIQGTDWGIRFLILSAFGGLMLLARLYSQVAVQYKMVEYAEKSEMPKLFKVIKTLRFSYPLEVILGVALLIATGFIMITTPPVWEKNTFELRAESQNTNIILSEHPKETEQLLLKFDSDESMNNAVVTLTNSEQGIGPIVAELERRTDKTFSLAKGQFNPAGRWLVDVTGQKSGGYDATANFSFNYPNDINDGRLDQSQRTFGLFELIVIVNAIGILGLTIILLGINWYLKNRFEKNVRAKNIILEGAVFPKWTSLIIPVGVLLLIAIWQVTPALAKSGFQRMCEQDGNAWHSMTPTRNGKVLSQNASVGCMIAGGQFHIADKNEYEYFVRPVNSVVEISHQSISAGQQANLTFNIKTDGQPVEGLNLSHERLLHVVIVGQDLNSFAHIHPEDFAAISSDVKKSAKFDLKYTFPKAGKYLVAVDYAVKAQSFAQKFYVNVEGVNSMGPVTANSGTTKKFGDYTVSFKELTGFAKAGEDVTLQYEITKDNKLVIDLQPYLAAAMHLAVVKDDSSQFIHTHGEVHVPGQATPVVTSGHFHPAPPSRFGPNIEAHVKFPEPGVYRIFGQFQHNNQVVLTSFDLKVE